MVERLEQQVEKEQRDLEILRAVIESGPIGIVSLAEETDLPKHKVRYSLRMLENDGLVDPTPEGAVPADGVADEVERINAGIEGLIERLEDFDDIF